jgi:hypothetical protein
MSEESPEPGRPTKYEERFTEELLDYFGVKPYSEVKKTLVTKKGEELDIVEHQASDFPSFAGFAAKIGVHRDTLHEWCKNHDEFSDAYKKAKEMQENWTLVNGHKGTCNTAFAIFAAKNIHGYRDKQPGEDDKTITLNDLRNKKDEELDQELEDLETQLDD